MSIHYRTTVSMYGRFPIVLAEGPTETGKSNAMKAGLSLLGMSKTGFYMEGTNRFLIERSAMSSLPYDIDEACSGSKELDLVKLIVDLHGGGKNCEHEERFSPPQKCANKRQLWVESLLIGRSY